MFSVKVFVPVEQIKDEEGCKEDHERQDIQDLVAEHVGQGKPLALSDRLPCWPGLEAPVLLPGHLVHGGVVGCGLIWKGTTSGVQQQKRVLQQGHEHETDAREDPYLFTWKGAGY